MNEPGHNERLLADVLGEGVSADFREVLLDETLRLARRRRRVRQARNATTALVVLVILGLLVLHQFPSGKSPLPLPAEPYKLVRTQPLPPAAWVETKSLTPSDIVSSVRTDNIILTARTGSPIRRLNDDELLALLPKPAALVRFGPHAAELVFVNATDRDELLRD